MAERIRFHAVGRDGTPGEVLGRATLEDGRVTATPGMAADTLAMLARRFGRSEAQVFRLMADRGWSNGQIMTVFE